ncbi:ankyrin repeats (3 copies) domain-containing protein [Penicillium coprophilum]|uniref:ankyrin repeats (3 copies) domain-containing protein n=1 Tax=Penicillium coprophilum TaxID=36646 RepID=UPI0023A1CB1E|nr:ankyrin repeats (3 copies) domain-containing protein [Penicillium coprophilum]KAJ5173842.1 ankyrin repeats (3 copies) domain-containing protein [Penicillium coprophilum]
MMNSNSAELLQAFEIATVQLKFCPNRVWAVAGEDLPNLLPHVETHEDHIERNKHELCTFDFCEYSRRDFTSVPQRCECKTEDCRKIGYQFPRRVLDEAARSGKSTVWKLAGQVMLESPRPFMAVSHVWSDGTGAGSWQEGEVKECLYGFFRDIAEDFGCEGIWWDTISIPREKAARTQAVSRMHINYQDARITLVHDLFLRNWEWDPQTACFAILMSPWFSRGWTALELAQSPKVKIIFKGPQGPIIKDLDEEILAKEDSDEEDKHEVRRRRASQIIRNLRRPITSVNKLLAVLGSRYTSWPKDLSIISALLVGVEPDESQQNTYMRIVRKLAKVSPGHLFHNAATMSGGSSWCPTSLFSMPLDNNPRSSLGFSDTGIEGKWRIISMGKALESNFMWTGSHPLIRHRIQDTLKKYPKRCLLLAECGSEPTQRALLVRILSEGGENFQPIRCQYVGAINLRNKMKFEEVKEVVIVHSDRILSEQKEQTPMTFEKKTSEALRQAIWRRDYAVFMKLVGQVDLNDPDELGRRPLHLAAERGQDQMVRHLVHLRAELNLRSHNGQTAFHHAVWGGSVQVVEFLKERVDEMATDRNGDTALHIATHMGFFFVAKALVSDRTIDAQGSNNLTPLHIASINGHLELANMFKDANIASKDSKFGWTPLHCAADSGNQHLVRLLLDRGAQVDVQDKYVGWTPLHFAAINGHVKVADTLLCFAASINAEDKYGWTPLEFAEANEHVEVIKLLKRNAANFPALTAEVLPYGHNWTLPHCMAINNERGLIKKLFNIDIKHSFDRSAPDAPIQLAAASKLETTIRKMLHNGTGSIEVLAYEGDTPLHWSARHGYERLTRVLLNVGPDNREAKNHATRTPLHCATEEGQEATIRLLLDAGVNKEAKIEGGERSMHLAAKKGHEAIVRLLVDAGADKQAKTGSDETPLHFAAKNGHKTIVRLLVNAGADKEAKSVSGGTPLHYAAEKGHETIVRMLLEAGADKEAATRTGYTPLHFAVKNGHKAIVRLLVDAGADKEAKLEGGERPLHLAAEKGHEAIFRTLLEAGADKEAKVKQNDRPFHLAAKGGHETIVRILLEAGADKEAATRTGYTPLYIAAYFGHETIVRLLLRANVETEPWNNYNGRTPLHEAARNGRKAIVHLLLEAGTTKDPIDDNLQSPLQYVTNHKYTWDDDAGNGCKAIARLLLGEVKDNNS